MPTSRAYVEAGLGPSDDPHRATYLLDHLGLTGEENPAELSGGEARRAALARVLAPQPDILLLDEPTNHLDLAAIEWLEEELARSASALVVISHDRRFLERVSRATVWLDRGQTRRLDKGFAHFEAWRDTLLEEEERDQHKLGRQILREEHWLRYGVTARRKRNMRRLGELQAMRQRFRSHRGAEGVASACRRARRRIRQAGDRGEGHRARALASCRGAATSRPASSAATASAWSARTAPARRRCLSCSPARLQPDEGTVRLGANLEIATLDQKRDASIPTRRWRISSPTAAARTSSSMARSATSSPT